MPELISGSCVLTPSRSVKHACAFAGSRPTIVPGFNAFSSSCSKDEAYGTCDRVCGDAVWECVYAADRAECKYGRLPLSEVSADTCSIQDAFTHQLGHVQLAIGPRLP